MIPVHPPAWAGLALTLGGDFAAVALLTGYVHLVWSRRRTPVTEADAVAVWAREHAPSQAREVLLLADGRTALVRTAEGGLGVVAARGRGWTTRVLQPADVRGVSLRGEAVRLRLRDYAHPALTLRFPSAETRSAWMRPLGEAAA